MNALLSFTAVIVLGQVLSEWYYYRDNTPDVLIRLSVGRIVTSLFVLAAVFFV